jgi:hypothetical protein
MTHNNENSNDTLFTITSCRALVDLQKKYITSNTYTFCYLVRKI